jgi:hypothetical protein
MKSEMGRVPVARIGTSWGGTSVLVFLKILDFMPVTARQEGLTDVV